MAERSESEITQAILTARREAGAGLLLITLTPPIERASAYRAPGQYIKVHAQSGGYFVLASEVGAPSWELLVRNSGGAADALSNEPEGTTFEISGPLGEGFPLERARGRSLIVAAVGSALAIVRPIARERIAEREMARTTIYLGVRAPNEVALAREVSGWARAGARVVLCISKADSKPGEPAHEDLKPTDNLVHASGWVQRVLTQDLASGVLGPEKTPLVFAAGPEAMLHELRELGGQGITRSDGQSVILDVVTNV